MVKCILAEIGAIVGDLRKGAELQRKEVVQQLAKRVHSWLVFPLPLQAGLFFHYL